MASADAFKLHMFRDVKRMRKELKDIKLETRKTILAQIEAGEIKF